MAKGPKQPRTRKKVLDRMVILALDKSNLLGKQIKAQLEGEFEPNDVPGLRTIQQYMSNARKEAKGNVQEQPWSLGTMDKAGIPWEAADWLLEHYKKCEERTTEGDQLWPLTNPYMTTLIEQREPVEGGWVYLTNRQAKWLWRVRFIEPALDSADPFCDLCHWADQYAYAEITAE